MQEKSSPINAIWLAMILISLSVALATGRADALNKALFESAKTAVTIALGLIGPMALWLGIMKVAEEGGLMRIISHGLRPVMKRLFPDIPTDHPAMSAIIMNMSANIMGLGNAATPMGIKAMQEMDRLNTRKGVATNSMALFLAINTSSVTLLPLGVITVRASAGADTPSSILLPAIFATTCSTIVAITACKLMENRDGLNPPPPQELPRGSNTAPDEENTPHRTTPPKGMERIFFSVLLIAFALLFIVKSAQWGIRVSLPELSENLPAAVLLQSLQSQAPAVPSLYLIPLILASLLGFGYFRGVKVYETVTDGAKEGFNTAVRIIPFMVAIIVGIGLIRASGTLDILAQILAPITTRIGMPVEAISLGLMRPLSGSGSFGMMAEIVSRAPNTFLADLVSSMQGSTETTFYLLAVYFGSVGIKKTRHALPAALLADFTGFIAAFVGVSLFL
ncbi:MAG: nucleoside recognition domain-containing protein [Fibrobacterota bacterium]